MVTLEVAERIPCMFPSSFVSVDGTEATAEPPPLVNAKEDPEHLTGSAVVVLTGLVPRHATGQGPGRYVVCEYGWQEVDRRWVASVGDAACLHELHIWRIVGRRAGLLAEADPGVRVCSHSAVSCWGAHWLRSRINVCEYTMTGSDRWAWLNVSVIGADAVEHILGTHKCSYVVAGATQGSMLGIPGRNTCRVGGGTVEYHGW
jgi:hypothetical protein